MKRIFLTSKANLVLEKLAGLANINPKNTSVAFIPTAADPYEDKSFVDEDRQKLLELGYQVTDIDLKIHTYETLTEILSPFNIIFVAGGNSFYLLEKCLEVNFKKILEDLLEEKIYIGSSAGAVILGPNIEPYKNMDDPSKAQKLESYSGINIINFLVLPHFGKQKYKQEYQELLSAIFDTPYFYITLQNTQAVWLANGTIQLIEV